MPRTKKVVDNTFIGLKDIVDDGTTVATVQDVIKSNTFSSLEPKVIEKIVEVPVEKIVVKTIIKEVEKPRLEGYELYAKMKEFGYFQGGIGAMMENPNGLDKVYIPEVSEIYPSFSLDPENWSIVRDALCRVWIELHEQENQNIS